VSEGSPPDIENGSDSDETEGTVTRGGGTVARFFLLPLAVVGAAVLIFLAFSLITFERRSPADYLQEVRGGTANRRWQAAFELSREVSRISPGPEREALGAETLRIFEGLSGKRAEDVRVRRYLVLVLGRLQSRSAVPQLIAATRDPDPETRLYSVWALGMIGDRSALDAVVESSLSDDAGARKMAAYVLGRLGDPRAVPRLRVLLEDSVPDVRWNAAISLASLGDSAGLSVLRSVIDRDSLSRQASLSADQSEVAITGALKAIEMLRDKESLPLLEKAAREDPNLRVRAAARTAIDAIRSGRPAPERPLSMNVERPESVLVV
jgi:HEAT repeat protein